MKTVTVVSDDRLGLLADISYVLGKSNVNIEGLFVDVVGGKAVISLEVRDTTKASEILTCNGFETTDNDAIVIKVQKNNIEKITEMLDGKKIKTSDVSKLSSDSNDEIFALKVDKPRKASKVLSAFVLGSGTSQNYY